MPPRKRASAKAPEVDETVKNQENPGTSTEDRSSDDNRSDEVAEMAPANEVDVTVVNQENLGAGEVVDRNPDPQPVENPITGATYDVSKAHPELVDPDQDEREARQARLRQTTGVMNAKEIEDPEGTEEREETPKIKIEFLESGLTANRKVWKKGEILELDDVEQTHQENKDTEDQVWYELTANQQKDKYGKVFFEKR